jgi:RNA 2',3'-cyclic 3'-phosphodiesterase
MRTRPNFRYFLGISPDPQCLPQFQRVCDALALPSRLDHAHLTLCTIAETDERDHFIAGRVRRALRDAELWSFPVNLSRVCAGPAGAFARTLGRQDEIQDAYRSLVRLLRACGIEPLHRKSGLHPHVTLAYGACPAALLEIAIRWFPSELILIESEIGRTKHNELARWPLGSPRQLLLPFDEGLARRQTAVPPAWPIDRR